MKRVVLHGCYANRNYGDLLMADLLSQYIENRTGSTPICPWVHPTEEETSIAKPGAGIEDCKRADVAVLGGGGYLEASTKTAARRLSRYLEPARVWRERSIPYSIVGVGVGPDLKFDSSRIIREICEDAIRIAVRDEESRLILLDIGVPEKLVQTKADLVLGLRPGQIPDWAKQRASELLAPSREVGKRVFGFHAPLGRSHGSMTRDLLRQFAEAFPQESDVDVVWFDDSPFLYEYHKSIAAELMPWARVLPDQNRWIIAATIAEMSAVFTVKLHVGITAWALGVPCCSLSVHPKTRRFFAQVHRHRFQQELIGLVSFNNHFQRALIRAHLKEEPRLIREETAILAGWLAEYGKPDSPFFHDDHELRLRIQQAALSNYGILDELLERV